MNCKNCNNTLKETQKYCDECGAKVIQNRLTPKVLIHQINEEFWTFDNKFLMTFINLIRKPERVIEGYIKGIRKRFIGVIPYYAISLTVLGFQLFILKNFFPEYLEVQNQAMTEGFMMGSNGKGKEFLDNITLVANKLNDYQGVLFSLFMPFLAIGTWIVYLDKQNYNYTEHLVINLYTNSQLIFFNFVLYIGFASVASVGFVTVSLISLPITVLYGAFIFKRLYQSSYLNALVRYFGALILYMITFLIIMFIVMIAIILYLKFRN